MMQALQYLCSTEYSVLPRHFDDIVTLVPANWSVYNILLVGQGRCVKKFSHTSMAKWKSQVNEMLLQLIFVYSSINLINLPSTGSNFAPYQ